MITQVGVTTDNRPVVAGVMRFRETYGLPLGVIFDVLERRGFVVSWLHLLDEAHKIGVNESKFGAELRTAIIDVYGKEYADALWTALY